MNRFVLSIALLMSSSCSITMADLPVCVSCPCVTKEGGSCCCTARGEQCCCVEAYAKEGSVPATCPCPKTIESCCAKNDSAQVEISYGELFDKITILEIKVAEITDEKKLKHIRFELSVLTKVMQGVLNQSADRDALLVLKKELKEINWQLWQTEDALRIKETEKNFDEEFVTLARNVYICNDARAVLKRQISDLLHSRIVEEKSYVQR